LILGLLAWGSLGVVVSQAPSGVALWTYTTLFPTDPLGVSWTDRALTGNSFLWKSGGVTYLTDSKNSGWHAATLDTEASDGQNQSCIFQVRFGADTDHYSGCLFRVDEANYATSGHIMVVHRGNGWTGVFEYTGNTLDNQVFPVLSSTDCGVMVNGGVAGLSIEGQGVDTIVRCWGGWGTTPPANKYDPSTWGTCTLGASNAASGSGCTTHYDADVTTNGFSASGYADGYNVGIQHNDVGADGNYGQKEVWFSDCDTDCG
jgi:hypothetical protein